MGKEDDSLEESIRHPTLRDRGERILKEIPSSFPRNLKQSSGVMPDFPMRRKQGTRGHEEILVGSKNRRASFGEKRSRRMKEEVMSRVPNGRFLI
jgi:hypothetical protein